MPFYMFQARYAPHALKSMIENPQDREAAARPMIEAVGGTLHSLFFCMGSDDVVAIIEAPNDAAMAAGSLVVGASGAFSGGSTTKLMTAAEAIEAMKAAQTAASKYTPPTGG